MTEKCFQRFIIYYLDAEAHLSGRNRAFDALQLLWDHTELLPEHTHKAQDWLPEIKEQAELIWSLPLRACLMMYWRISLTSALCGQLASSTTLHHSDVCVSVVQTMKTENAPFGVCSMPSSHTFGLYVFSAKVSAQDKINDTVTKASPLPNTQCQ